MRAYVRSLSTTTRVEGSDGHDEGRNEVEKYKYPSRLVASVAELKTETADETGRGKREAEERREKEDGRVEIQRVHFLFLEPFWSIWCILVQFGAVWCSLAPPTSVGLTYVIYVVEKGGSQS